MSGIALSQARKELLLSTSSHRHGRYARKNMAKMIPNTTDGGATSTQLENGVSPLYSSRIDT